MSIYMTLKNEKLNEITSHVQCVGCETVRQSKGMIPPLTRMIFGPGDMWKGLTKKGSGDPFQLNILCPHLESKNQVVLCFFFKVYRCFL